MALTVSTINKLNFIAVFLHAAQFVAQVTLTYRVPSFRDFKLPVVANYLSYDSQAEYLYLKSRTIYLMPIAPLIYIFFLLTAVFHSLVLIPQVNKYYVQQLNKGRNAFRWIEYSLTSSLMIIVIALFFGIYDVTLLTLIGITNANMNFSGLLMERINKSHKTVKWLPYLQGCLSGISTWIPIITYLAYSAGESNLFPKFVIGVLVSYFFFFNTFAVNMLLQFGKVGKWKEPFFSEYIYILLSLASKSLLGWLVYSGLNQPNKYNH